MGEPVPEESHGSPGDSLWVDVPATQDSLELRPLPPPAPTEAETLPSSEAMITVEHPVDGQDGESAAEQERTELHQAVNLMMGANLISPGSAHPSSSAPAPHTPPNQMSSLRSSDPGYTSTSTPGLTQDNTPATSRYIATPPDLQNALKFSASSQAPTFLLGARLLMNRFPRNPPVQTELPYGLAGTQHFVSDRGRLVWSDGGHSLSGTFGIIYTDTLERPPPVMTVKVLSNSEARLLPRRREEYIYRNLDNLNPDREHILSFYGSFDYPDSRGPCAIVLGKCTITLSDVLQAHYNRITWYPSWREKLPEFFTKIAISGILMGLRFLADKSIGHRSLRPEHVVISLDEPRQGMVTAKLADFTCASNLSLTKPAQQPPLTFTPPEVVFAGVSFNQSSDVWCAGCILAHMLMGNQLCSATTRQNYMVSFRPCMSWEVWFTEKIWTNQSRPENWTKLTPSTASFMYENDWGHDRSATSLLRYLLQFRPLSRASAADALGMPYVRFGAYERMHARVWLMDLL
ncbi:hypothetical protein JCM24511_00545 [Saitozyma sp. JCM 24511]|nr:hypothetical protein JCM24511_00545 [Saitozyma sp. JCM 24511]